VIQCHAVDADYSQLVWMDHDATAAQAFSRSLKISAAAYCIGRSQNKALRVNSPSGLLAMAPLYAVLPNNSIPKLDVNLLWVCLL
jgi:hypothetical protein